MKHLSCFGLDSPFGYLIKNRGKNLFIGIDYKDALTFVHVAEEQAKVDYRYHKIFSGNYINVNGMTSRVDYKMYVRKEGKVISTIIDKKFDDKLLEKNALIKKSFNGITFSVIDIQIAFNLMIDDLKSKSGINLSEYNKIKMSELFKNLNKFNNTIALIDEKFGKISYSDLIEKSCEIKKKISSNSIALLVADNSSEFVMGYIAFEEEKNYFNISRQFFY